MEKFIENNKIIIIFPLALEMNLFLENLSKKKYTFLKKLVNNSKINVFTNKSESLIICNSGTGAIKTAITSQLMHGYYPQHRQVLMGSCGALRGDIKAGSVIIADNIIEYSERAHSTRPNIHSFKCDNFLTEKFNNFNEKHPKYDFDIINGDTISSENFIDINNDERLTLKYNPIGIAWEGAGLAHTANLLDFKFNEIRCVTDLNNGSTKQDFKKNIQTSMKHLALFWELI